MQDQVHSDRRLACEEIAKKLNFSRWSVHSFICNHLGRWKYLQDEYLIQSLFDTWPDELTLNVVYLLNVKSFEIEMKQPNTKCDGNWKQYSSLLWICFS